MFYMHVMGFHISLPPITPEQANGHVMCRAVHALQTVEWMDAKYYSDHPDIFCPLMDWHARLTHVHGLPMESELKAS